MKLLRTLTVITALSLTGCASSSIVQYSAPTVQSNLVEPCAALDEFTGESLGKLVVYTQGLIAQYGDCRSKHKALADTVTNQ